MRRMLCLNFMPLWEAGETDLHHTFNICGKTHALWLSRSSEGYRLELAGGWSGPVALVEKREGEARLIVDGRSEPIIYVRDGEQDSVVRVQRSRVAIGRRQVAEGEFRRDTGQIQAERAQYRFGSDTGR